MNQFHIIQVNTPFSALKGMYIWSKKEVLACRMSHSVDLCNTALYTVSFLELHHCMSTAIHYQF